MTSSPPDITPPVEAVRQSLAELIKESQALRTDVRSAEQARKRASQINLLAVGVVVILVGLLLMVAWQNNAGLRQGHDTNERIADCTTPGGACYEEGRKRTGDAIGDIIRAEIFMAQCSRLYPGESGPAFDRKLEQCVHERLAEAAKQRVAAPSPTPAPTATPR